MPVGAHMFQDRGHRLIQVQKDIAGIQVVGIRLDVDVTALAIANAEETYRRLLAQLGARPQPFSRKGSFGGVVNQADEIQFVRHCRELPADGLQREEQSTIGHKGNCRRYTSPYNALMVWACGRRTKSYAGNGRCPNSWLSQKRAQSNLCTV